MIAKGSTKTEVKEKLASKVEEKPEKYRNAKFILLYITTQEADNKFIFGDLLVNICHYEMNNSNKLKSKSKSDIPDYVWFTKKYLEENGWKNEYLTKIVDVVNKNKVEFNIMSMPNYTSIEYL